jgi:hypothetical protein
LGVRLILVVTTREHRYTHMSLYKERELDVAVVSYDRVLKRKQPYRATHIFTDLDRLPNWQLHEAALLYLQLRSSGVRALNDPARFAGRFGLLRGLNRVGINSFDAYRADGWEWPRKWPVFLRLEGNHAAPVSGLLNNEEELEQALQTAIDNGAPRAAILIIEHAAEPVRPGVYRKLSVFRVGDRLLGYTCVHDDNWLVKYGKLGITTPELYDEEYSFVAKNPFGPAVKPAFDLAGIDYGRVDFGLVDGKPQIYEINSNPDISLRPRMMLSERRNKSLALFRINYIEAMKEIDVAPRPVWRQQSAFLARSAQRLPGQAVRLAARRVGN